MRKSLYILSIMIALIAMLVVGCAEHDPLTPVDGHGDKCGNDMGLRDGDIDGSSDDMGDPDGSGGITDVDDEDEDADGGGITDVDDEDEEQESNRNKKGR